MPNVLLTSPTKNAVQKTLAAQLLNTATTADPITFDDVDGIPNLPGVLVIRRVDTSGVATPSFREYIEYSGTSGTTVLITTRNVDSSNAALTHPIGSIVEFIPNVTWADRIYDALSLVVNVSDVTLLNSSLVTLTGTQTLTNKTINGATMASTTSIIDANFVSRKTKVFSNGNAGASLAINLNNGETQSLTLSTTLATISLQNMEEGDYLSLYAIQASGFSGSLILAQSGGRIRYSGGASLPDLQRSNRAVNLLGIRAFNASISDVVAVAPNFV